MPYTAQINRSNPTAILFVIDQSGSMSGSLGSATGVSERSKSQEVANIINRSISNLLILCQKGEETRRYFQIGLIGYGNARLGDKQVGSVFQGELQNKDLVWTDELDKHPLRVDIVKRKINDGAGGIIEQEFPQQIWLEPESANGTPMTHGLTYAHDLISDWVTQYPNAFPPIIFHITDGESTDGDPSAMAKKITELKTDDGNVILANLHLSTQMTAPIVFPNTDEGLPDEYAQMLFKMSSVLPPTWQGTAKELNMPVTEDSRCFVFNADFNAIYNMIDIGTRHTTLVMQDPEQ